MISFAPKFQKHWNQNYRDLIVSAKGFVGSSDSVRFDGTLTAITYLHEFSFFAEKGEGPSVLDVTYHNRSDGNNSICNTQQCGIIRNMNKSINVNRNHSEGGSRGPSAWSLPSSFSPLPLFLFYSFSRKQRRCRCYTAVMAILDFTIWVSLLLPPLFSLSPSPFPIWFFPATLRKQGQSWCYTAVTAILDFTIESLSFSLPSSFGIHWQ